MSCVSYYFVPFLLINKLVTRRSASLGDFELKNFGGVIFGGKVVVLRVAVDSQALNEPCNLSKCSVEADARG